MKVEELYKLSCQIDTNFYETDFYSSETEVLNQLSDFKNMILENDDTIEESEIEIRLESITLSDINDILSYSNPKILSLWLPQKTELNDEYCVWWVDAEKDIIKTDLKNMIKKLSKPY